MVIIYLYVKEAILATVYSEEWSKTGMGQGDPMRGC